MEVGRVWAQFDGPLTSSLGGGGGGGGEEGEGDRSSFNSFWLLIDYFCYVSSWTPVVNQPETEPRRVSGSTKTLLDFNAVSSDRCIALPRGVIELPRC